MDPLLFLFGVLSTPCWGDGSRSLPRWVHLCLLAAKRCILTLWIHHLAPTITNLTSDMLERRDAELSFSNPSGTLFKCREKFIHFTFNSMEIEDLMNTFQYGHWYITWRFVNWYIALSFYSCWSTILGAEDFSIFYTCPSLPSSPFLLPSSHIFLKLP